jgi:hypothetical protein
LSCGLHNISRQSTYSIAYDSQQSSDNIEIRWLSLLMHSMGICILFTFFVMEMARPTWREDLYHQDCKQPNRHPFITEHHSLGESGVFMPPVHPGHGRCRFQNGEELLDAVHANLSNSTWITHEMGLYSSAFGINCMRNNCILFMYSLYKGGQPGNNNLCLQFDQRLLHNSSETAFCTI